MSSKRRVTGTNGISLGNAAQGTSQQDAEALFAEVQDFAARQTSLNPNALTREHMQQHQNYLVVRVNASEQVDDKMTAQFVAQFPGTKAVMVHGVMQLLIPYRCRDPSHLQRMSAMLANAVGVGGGGSGGPLTLGETVRTVIMVVLLGFFVYMICARLFSSNKLLSFV